MPCVNILLQGLCPEKGLLAPLQSLKEKGKVITIYCCVVVCKVCGIKWNLCQSEDCRAYFDVSDNFREIKCWQQIPISCKIQQLWLVTAPQVGHGAGRSIHLLRTRVCTMVGDYWHKQSHRLVISLTLLGSLMPEMAWPDVSGDPQTDPQSL